MDLLSHAPDLTTKRRKQPVNLVVSRRTIRPLWTENARGKRALREQFGANYDILYNGQQAKQAHPTSYALDGCSFNKPNSGRRELNSGMEEGVTALTRTC